MRRNPLSSRIIASILAGALFLPATDASAGRPAGPSHALRETQEDPGTLQAISAKLQKSTGLEERPKGLPGKGMSGFEGAAIQSLLLMAMVGAHKAGNLAEIIQGEEGEVILGPNEVERLFQRPEVMERLPSKDGKPHKFSVWLNGLISGSAYNASMNIRLINSGLNDLFRSVRASDGGIPNDEDDEFCTWRLRDAAVLFKEAGIRNLQLVRTKTYKKPLLDRVEKSLQGLLAQYRQRKAEGKKVSSGQIKLTPSTADLRTLGEDGMNRRAANNFLLQAFKPPRQETAQAFFDEFGITGIEIVLSGRSSSSPRNPPRAGASARLSTGLEEASGRAKADRRAERLAGVLRAKVAALNDPKEAFRYQIHPGGILKLAPPDAAKYLARMANLSQIAANDALRKAINRHNQEAFARKKKDHAVSSLEGKGIRRLEIAVLGEVYNPVTVGQEVFRVIHETLGNLRGSIPKEVGIVEIAGSDISEFTEGQVRRDVLNPNRNFSLGKAIQEEMNRLLENPGGRMMRKEFGVTQFSVVPANRSPWLRRVREWEAYRANLAKGEVSGSTVPQPKRPAADFALAASEIIHNLTKKPALLARQRGWMDKTMGDGSTGRPFQAFLHSVVAAWFSNGTIGVATLRSREDYRQAVNLLLEMAFRGTCDLGSFQGPDSVKERVIEAVARLEKARQGGGLDGAAEQDELVRLWEEAKAFRDGPLKLTGIRIGPLPYGTKLEDRLREMNPATLAVKAQPRRVGPWRRSPTVVAGAIARGLLRTKKGSEIIRMEEGILQRAAPEARDRPLYLLLRPSWADKFLNDSGVDGNPALLDTVNKVFRLAFGWEDPFFGVEPNSQEETELVELFARCILSAPRQLQEDLINSAGDEVAGRMASLKKERKSQRRPLQEKKFLDFWEAIKDLKEIENMIGIVIEQVGPKGFPEERFLRLNWLGPVEASPMEWDSKDVFSLEAAGTGDGARQPQKPSFPDNEWLALEAAVKQGRLRSGAPIWHPGTGQTGVVERIERNGSALPQIQVRLNWKTAILGGPTGHLLLNGVEPEVSVPLPKPERFSKELDLAVRRTKAWEKVPFSRIRRAFKRALEDLPSPNPSADWVVFLTRAHLMGGSKRAVLDFFPALPQRLLDRIFLLQEIHPKRADVWDPLVELDPRWKERVVLYESVEETVSRVRPDRGNLTPLMRQLVRVENLKVVAREALGLKRALPLVVSIGEPARKSRSKSPKTVPLSSELAKLMESDGIKVVSLEYDKEREAFFMDLLTALGFSDEDVAAAKDKITAALVKVLEKTAAAGVPAPAGLGAGLEENPMFEPGGSRWNPAYGARIQEDARCLLVGVKGEVRSAKGRQRLWIRLHPGGMLKLGQGYVAKLIEEGSRSGRTVRQVSLGRKTPHGNGLGEELAKIFRLDGSAGQKLETQARALKEEGIEGIQIVSEVDSLNDRRMLAAALKELRPAVNGALRKKKSKIATAIVRREDGKLSITWSSFMKLLGINRMRSGKVVEDLGPPKRINRLAKEVFQNGAIPQGGWGSEKEAASFLADVTRFKKAGIISFEISMPSGSREATGLEERTKELYRARELDSKA
ncbi:MAG: hypothetical protein HYS41_04655 [Candidatus Omnitrophica bacterium]|nr:hypothetical protein [Candidatus Omnitrophota bacterium]